MRHREPAIIGCLLGTAVGDSIGLPCEGLSRRRQQKLYPQFDGPCLCFGRGMISDDTEHACMTAQALVMAAGDVERFSDGLARQLRGWLLCLPAGTGLATLKAALKLCLGVPPTRSGVYSAGNGPAMRSPIIGVCYGHDPQRLRDLVRASTRLTHTDPQAECGALAVALAAHLAATQDEVAAAEYLQGLRDLLGAQAPELLALVERAVASATAGHSTEDFADSMGLGDGVSGYIYHTVPVVLHAWLRHRTDFKSAIIEVVRCGGDTDSTAAILGAIIGAAVGKDGIPEPWLNRLLEWPRSVGWIEQVGRRLSEVVAQGVAQPAMPLPVQGVLARNMVFLSIVLAHGLRRLLPPY